MPAPSSRKTRGRTAKTRRSITGNPRSGTKPALPVEQRTEASRPIGGGTGKNRGDRRDMSPTYSGNKRHRSRGNDPRPDVKTRKR